MKITFRHSTDDNAAVDVQYVKFGTLDNDGEGFNSPGLKRDDTDEELVAPGVDLARVLPGVYEYELDEPEPGLHYTYFLTWLFNDIPQTDEFDIQAPVAEAIIDVAGEYADINDLYTEYGEGNIKAWSRLNANDTGAITARIQEALDFADSEINMKLSQGGYTVPLSGATTANLRLLQDIAVKIAGPWLAKTRTDKSNSDDEDVPSGMISMRSDYKWARNRLNLIATKILILSAARPNVNLAGYQPYANNP